MSNLAKWTLGSIAEEVGGTLSPTADPDTVVSDFHIRAWSCRQGSIFLPIFKAGPGMSARAVGRGAAAAMVDTEISDDIPHIKVKDLAAASLRLAKKRRREFSGKIVGITGSAGKSTTKTMLSHVLRKNSQTVYSTINNQNLTPYITASLCSLSNVNTTAIFEMAMYETDMVEKSSMLACPHVGIVTSIGMNHAEYHEDPETGILNSKAAIFDGLKPKSTAILPSGIAKYEQLYEKALSAKYVSEIISCGSLPTDEVRLLDAIETPTYSDVTISAGGEEVNYLIPTPGRHMIENSLLVAGALYALGHPLELMEKMKDYDPPRSSPRRFKMTFPDKEAELIDDAIISSPHQVRAMLGSIAQRNKVKRTLMVFGDMTALGPDDVDLHVDLAKEIEDAGVDKLIAVGPLSAHLADALKIPTKKYKNAFEAEVGLSDDIEDGDLVVLKASGQMNFKRIVNKLKSESKLSRAQIDWTIEASKDG